MIHRNNSGGLIASLLGILFGVIGIFAVAILFVPLAFLCGLIGVFRSRSLSAIALSGLAMLLSAVGYFMSPVLLALTSAALTAKVISDAVTPVPPPKPRPVVQQAAAVPTPKPEPKIAAPAPASPPWVPEQGNPEPERSEELRGRLGGQPRWIEIIKPIIACKDDEDTPELKQRTFQAIVAWQGGTTPPPGCGTLKPGAKLIDFDDQTEAEKRELLRLGVPNCKKGCVPFSSPVYAPPGRLFGPYARYTSPPPGW